MIELTEASTSEVPRLRQGLLFASALPVVALLLLIVDNPRGPATHALAGAAVLFTLWKAWVQSRRDPIWLGFVLLVWELFSAWVLIPSNIRPVASYGLTLLFCLPAVPILWRAWKGPTSNFKLYLIYFGWCLVTTTYSLSPIYSLARLIRSVLMFAGITTCSLRARQTGEIHRVIRYLTLACTVVSLATALAALALPHSISWGVELQHTGPNPEDWDEIPRFQGPFDNPSELGELALVTVGLTLTYLEFATKRERLLLILAAITAVILTALADSRSGLVALTCGISLYALWRYRLKGLLAIAAASLVVALALIIAGPARAPYLWRGQVWTLTGRTELWPFVIQQIAQRPIFGQGYSVAGAIFQSPYFPVWWGPYDQGVHSSVHNGYLARMVSVGIPAFIFWMFIMLRPWISLFSSAEDGWRLKRMFFFVVIPMLLVNLDEEMIGDCLGPSGFLFTAAWALAEQYRLATIRRDQINRREALRNMPAGILALRS